MRSLGLFLCLLLPALALKPDPAVLVGLAHKGGPALEKTLREVFGPNLAKGTAYAGHQGSFIFAIEAPSRPTLFINRQSQPPMKKLGQSLWYATASLPTGRAHTFHYMVAGARTGGDLNVPAYGPDSYEQPGVPKGTLLGKFVHTSKLYEGMQSDYWIYVPAQYDASKPACLMLWHDGHGLVQRDGPTRAQIVIDNLTHRKRIPVAIYVFVSPGKVGQKAMRSILYDTVNDKHARFFRDELLPEVYAKYNIRRDGYSRAVAGNSSGGISSFNIAWHQPDQFSRVLSRIGSFTSIKWIPGEIDGGNVYPNKVRKEPKRNIRVWLQDGSEDNENSHGSWPLQNIQMANSLKMREYDFHFSWGHGSHNGAHGNAELPEELTWLWRGYDPARTEEVYQMDPAEKDKPYFRVVELNR